MTVSKIPAGSAAAYADYLLSCDNAQVKRGDYYLGRDGSPHVPATQWHGLAAEMLGLRGAVSRDDVVRVWDGRDPRTGAQLVRRAGVEGDHVPGVDCSFSAPKSVSLVWALASPEHRAAIELAQDRAVAVALRHIEETVPLVRRRVDGVIRHEVAAGIAVTRVRHSTARLTDTQMAQGLTPDPQLHDHCVVASLALRKDDAHAVNGRWAAIDSRELYRVAAEGGAVYRAELASELGAMGYAVERHGRYFDIVGVPREVIRTFSSRTEEVKQATARFVAQYGRQPTAREQDRLTVECRNAKDADAAPAFDEWAARLDAIGFGADRAEGVRGETREPMEFEAACTEVLKELCDPRGEQGLAVKTAVVDRREVRTRVAEAAQGRVAGSDVERLIAAVCASPELVQLDEVHWTTRAMLETESRVIGTATAMANVRGRPLSPWTVDQAIASARVALSAEQVAAVRRLCDGRTFRMVTAPAGAGKGEVLRAASSAFQAEGRRVIALAAAGETAHRLGAEITATEARTIDSFTFRIDFGFAKPPRRGTVLVVDEAALLETWRWDALLAARGEAAIIVAGDGAQLSPIEAGGMWAVLNNRVGSAPLEENYRAQEPWARDAWSALREGAGVLALTAYEERGLIDVAEHRAAARVAAVDAWDRDRLADRAKQATDTREGRSLLLCDSSNVDVDVLNALAQERRRDSGELGKQVVVVTTSGDAGYRREERIHRGDAVTFERQVYLNDGSRQRVANGAVGVVVGVHPLLRRAIVDVGGRRVVLDAEQLEALRLGYAQHVYSAQGRTVDRAYVVTGGWQTDRERGYVAVSRARDATRVFADYSSLNVANGERGAALEELAARMARSRPKVAAISVMERAGWEVPEMSSVPVRTRVGEEWRTREHGGVQEARGRTRE